MNFKELYKRITPTLKKIATRYEMRGVSFDRDDLYQEMVIHLWNKFKDGVPEGINDAYIINGCKFHLMNYLRKNRVRANVVSFNKPLNETGNTLEDMMVAKNDSIDRQAERKSIFEAIMNNGYTSKEKRVFGLLLKGMTVREVGERLKITHVMVLKYKKNIINKWRKKNRVTKHPTLLLN